MSYPRSKDQHLDGPCSCRPGALAPECCAVGNEVVSAAISGRHDARKSEGCIPAGGNPPGVSIIGTRSDGCGYVDDMAWAEPAVSRNRVDQAGWRFVDPGTSASEREVERAVINNWRSSHSFPLNTFQVNLRNKAARVDPDALIAQRIKRLPSIRLKLQDNPRMRLSRMQDIGGCRAVVKDLETVQSIVDMFHAGRHDHVLAGEDDYIANPKHSGYRGHHLVYRYNSRRSTAYNNLRIEVQIRTRVQHAWATAVETVGTFTNQALKSSHGEADWLRFFALMSAHMADDEGAAGRVPGTPDDPAVLQAEIRELANKLDVLHRLQAFSDTLRLVERDARSKVAKYFVLQLDVSSGIAELEVSGFRDLRIATEVYGGLERAAEQASETDVVLVSVDVLTSLRRAYPNYYLDTGVFRDAVEEVLLHGG